jgi:AmmeMemoRadiSam system protein A
MLTPEAKRELLLIAREAILGAIQNRPYAGPGTIAEELIHPGGAFVTIRIGRELRGCIGYVESPRPLAEVVADVARKAACEDPRFAPVTFPEFEHANLEISILSPLRHITMTEEIEVGTHGLLLEVGMNRGLLLPQVALEYGWDREAFLDATARKSGLNPSAWREPGARIYVFSAEIVTETEIVEGENAS